MSESVLCYLSRQTLQSFNVCFLLDFVPAKTCKCCTAEVCECKNAPVRHQQLVKDVHGHVLRWVELIHYIAADQRFLVDMDPQTSVDVGQARLKFLLRAERIFLMVLFWKPSANDVTSSRLAKGQVHLDLLTCCKGISHQLHWSNQCTQLIVSRVELTPLTQTCCHHSCS